MRSIRTKYVMTILLTIASLFFASGCELPDNYWAGAWGDGLFLAMVAAANAVLAATTGGALEL